jgi:NhaP-type Na+/H+ and K+/H+ antiporter
LQVPSRIAIDAKAEEMAKQEYQNMAVEAMLVESRCEAANSELNKALSEADRETMHLKQQLEKALREKSLIRLQKNTQIEADKKLFEVQSERLERTVKDLRSQNKRYAERLDNATLRMDECEAKHNYTIKEAERTSKQDAQKIQHLRQSLSKRWPSQPEAEAINTKALHSLPFHVNQSIRRVSFA